jgi:hypothetical protein
MARDAHDDILRYTGLRVIMAYLSRLPVTEWWDSWTSADRAAA